MKSEKRMQAVAAVGVCFAIVFITSGAQAQETKETVKVNGGAISRFVLIEVKHGVECYSCKLRKEQMAKSARF